VGHLGEVRRAVFAPDGSRILTASVDGTARLWNVESKAITILAGHEGAVDRAVFAPDATIGRCGYGTGTASRRPSSATRQPSAI
jgi:WD40 repeat protein